MLLSCDTQEPLCFLLVVSLRLGQVSGCRWPPCWRNRQNVEQWLLSGHTVGSVGFGLGFQGTANGSLRASSASLHAPYFVVPTGKMDVMGASETRFPLRSQDSILKSWPSSGHGNKN